MFHSVAENGYLVQSFQKVEPGSTVTLDGKVIHESKLVAAKKVEVAGIFGRLWDSIKLLFQ